MWIVSLILFIFILGIIILVHEFGHFITAKKSGVFIYEFSIGMGPVIFSHKGKDGIYYNIRALPIGGFVQMAGEVYEDDTKIPKEKFLCNRPWYQRLLILSAGVINNFLLALILLFLLAIIWGSNVATNKIAKVEVDSAASKAGLKDNDEIIAINGHKISNWDVGQIYLYYKVENNTYEFEVKHENGEIQKIKVVPDKVKNENGEEQNVFGINLNTENEKGLWGSIKYAFTKFGNVIHSMAITIGGLITGQISVNNLSGPVGIYKVIDTSMQYGIAQLIYITAFLCINVGFINILPFPAFDGGHIFFMIVEKIKGSPINAKFESICNMVGFALLMILMIYITIQDILHLF